MPKKIILGEEARRVLQDGIDTVANAVKVTLGPKGRNVAVSNMYSMKIVNDGVTIAKEINLSDPQKNAGIKLIQEVCSKTNDDVGDGTTSTAVLTQSLVKNGLKHVVAGNNPMGIKRGIEKARTLALQHLDTLKQDVSTNDQVRQVATISAGNDEFIGKLIAEAVEKVGKDGIITVEDSKSTETSLDVTEGIQLDRGYISPHFVVDQNEKMEVIFDDPYILLSKDPLNLVNDIVAPLEEIAREGKPLVIIAENVEGEVLATLVANTMRRVVKTVAIKMPGVGDHKKEAMNDLAALTGATPLDKDAGLTLNRYGKDFDKDFLLGKARQVKVDGKKTVVVAYDNVDVKENVEKRIDVLRNQLEAAESSYEKDKLQERLAKLAGGVAVVKLGAATETELKDKKLRIEDALNATKAALSDGIVPGGGTTFVRLAQFLESNMPEGLDMEEGLGFKSVIQALYSPTKQIAENCGESGEVVLNQVKTIGTYEGYNASTGQYTNMIDSGVIDPVKVIRAVVENSTSIAGIILTTETLVVEVPDPKKDAMDDFAGSLPY